MNSKSRLSLVAVLSALALVATGCAADGGDSPGTGGGGEGAGVVNGEEIASQELIDAACEEGVVSYYSSQNQQDETDIIQPFLERFPCMDVEVFAAGSAQVAARLETEAQAGQNLADVAMLTSPMSFASLAEQGVLAEWTPPSADKYPEAAKVDGQWYAGSASIMEIVYNNQIVDEADAPKSWEDLLDPRWKGKLATATPMSGGANWSMWWMLRDQIGADDYWEQLAQQDVKLYTGQSSVATGVERGEFPIVMVCDLCVYSAINLNGAPLTEVTPDEGVAYVPYGVGIMADAPHPAAAELFANWYLSAEGQASVVNVRGAYSARSDVDPAPGKAPIDSLTLITPPLDVISAEQDSLIADFRALLGEGEE